MHFANIMQYAVKGDLFFILIYKVNSVHKHYASSAYEA